MEPGNAGLLVVIAAVSFLLSFIGAAVGLVLGHLRLPLLIAYLGSPSSGAMLNLLVSGSGAFSGAAGHIRHGRISWHALALMGIPSAIGAITAVILVVQVSPYWSFFIIGIILAISGVKLMRTKKPIASDIPISRSRQMIIEVILGLSLGALAAITGLMLGSLRLPMMIRYLHMDTKEAIGTNMAVGCLTAIVGAATGLIAGTSHLNWLVLGVVIPPTLIGGYLGGWLTGRLSKERVQQLAGGVIAVTGVILVGQGATIAFRKPPENLPPLIIDESEFDGWFELVLPDDDDDEKLPEQAIPVESEG